MKKISAIIIAIALILSFCFGTVTVNAAEDYGLHNPTIDENGLVTWDCVTFGTLPYKDEAITWRVLDVSMGVAYLMADKCVGTYKFDYEVRTQSWENSALRATLNDYFYNSTFSEAEKDAIIETYINTEAGVEVPASQTLDKVWVPSATELTHAGYGFDDDKYLKSETRIADKANCLYGDGVAHKAWGYYLRTPSDLDRYHCYVPMVLEGGDITMVGYLPDTSTDVYVRPMIRIDLSQMSWHRAGSVSAQGHKHKASKTVIKKADTRNNGSIKKMCSCGKVISSSTIKKINSIKAATTSFIYNGKAHKPSVTVMDADVVKRTKDVDYSVKYSSTGKAVGKHTITVTGKGNYGFTEKINYTVKPKKAVISSLTPGTGKLTVKMSTKVAATGGSNYKIAYKVKGTKTWKNVTTTAQSKTISKLKKGKCYDVRVRAYKKVNGTTYSGAWSTTKVSKKVK